MAQQVLVIAGRVESASHHFASLRHFATVRLGDLMVSSLLLPAQQNSESPGVLLERHVDREQTPWIPRTVWSLTVIGV